MVLRIIAEHRIYWCDGVQGTIQSIKINGSDRRVDMSNYQSRPFSVASTDDYIYYSDWNNNNPAIQRWNRKAKLTDTLGHDLIYGLNDIKYFDRSAAFGKIKHI